MTTLQRKKVTDPIAFSPTLDLAPFLCPPEVIVEQAAAAGAHDAFASADEGARQLSESGVGSEYELFAVMMHTGGTHGGHYFAYIKDLTTSVEGEGEARRRWIRFNDSSVTSMSRSHMASAFGTTEEGVWDAAAAAVIDDRAPDGGEAPPKGASDPDSVAPSVASAFANAYMLVYRRKHVKPIPAMSHPPRTLVEEVEADNAEFAVLKREWEWERELVRLRVRLDETQAGMSAEEAMQAGSHETSGKLASLVVHRSRTVDDLVLLCAGALGLLDPAMCPSSGAAGPGVDAAEASVCGGGDEGGEFLVKSVDECLRRCRLRFFDSMKGLLLAPLKPGDADSPPSLQSLGGALGPHKLLALELRDDTTEPWPAWREGGVTVKALLFKPPSSDTGALGSFHPPVQVSADEDSLGALRRAVEDCFTLHSRCRLVHVRGDDAVVLEGPPSTSLKKELRILDGDSVYVEPHRADEDVSGKPSAVKELLESVANAVQVEFEPLTPLSTEQIAELSRMRGVDDPSALTTERLVEGVTFVTIDQRGTLGELRAEVERATGAIPGTIRVLQPPHGPEMKDDSRPLSFFGLVGGGRVVLERGRPLQPSEFMIKVTLFDGSVEETTTKRPSAAGRGRPARPPRGAARPKGPSSKPRSRFQPLGVVIADRSCPVPALKELVVTTFGLPKLPNHVRLRERSGQNLTGLLLDCRTLDAALSSRIVDNKEIVVELLDEAEFAEEGALLLHVHRWFPDTAKLEPAKSEIAVTAMTTFGDLKKRLAASSVVPAEAIVFAKLGAFGSRAPEQIAKLEHFGKRKEGAGDVRYGCKQPSDGSQLAGTPWRLRSGATLLWKDGRVDEALLSEGEGPAATSSERGDGYRAEIAFRIYTPEEQRQREEERRRRKEALDAQIREAEARAQQVAADADARSMGAPNLKPYVMMLRGGVTAEGVEAKMRADGFDPELLFPEVVDEALQPLEEGPPE
jgi:hypothetical protein